MEYSHIKTIKNPKEQQKKPHTKQENFVQKTSFAVETDAKLESISASDLPGISTLAGNLQGGTFAQRARAAELQAARARSELKSKNPQASPSPPPRRLLKLKMPRRQKWTPLDLNETPSQETFPTNPEIGSHDKNLEQRLVEGQFVGDDEGEEEPVQEPESAVQNDQIVMDHNSNNRSEHFTSRLYGSRPTSTLQSHDLAEYPAELGARISDNMPSRFEHFFREEESQPSTGRTEKPLNDQPPKIYFRRSATDQASPTPDQIGEDTYFDPLNMDHLEQNLEKAFAKIEEKRYSHSHLRPDIHQACEDTISDPAILVKSEAAKTALKKSFAAVRGTPTANIIAARFAQKFLDKARYFASSVTIPRGTEVPRKVSEQDKDFLRRQLDSIDERIFHTNTERGPQLDPIDEGIFNTNTERSRQEAFLNSFDPQKEHFGNPTFARDFGYPTWNGDQAPQKPVQNVQQHGSYEMGMMSLNAQQQYGQQHFGPIAPMAQQHSHHQRGSYEPGIILLNNRNRDQYQSEFLPIPYQQNGQYQPGPHHRAIWAPDRNYHGSRQNEKKVGFTAEEKRATVEREVGDWWVRDNRVPIRAKYRIEEAVRKEGLAMKQIAYLQGAAAQEQDIKEGKIKDPAAPYKNEDMVKDLLIPAIATLNSYKTDRTSVNPFSKPPSWAIDHSPAGNESFFSQQWGTPPQRVGRDPRYRAMQHDGRSSVFEDPTGRFPREEFSHGGGGRRGPF